MGRFHKFFFICAVLSTVTASPAPQNSGTASIGTSLLPDGSTSSAGTISTESPGPETDPDIIIPIVIDEPPIKGDSLPEPIGQPPQGGGTPPDSTGDQPAEAPCTGTTAECAPICALNPNDPATWGTGGGELQLMAWFQENGTGKEFVNLKKYVD